ncbi:MAG: dihydropteroate synthase [Ancrocorticia sp.]|uniref:dihydropteroate synthase n=1 Tax=Ancrocorticia sp. TaxID=2593684 RepID=UPI003F9307EB
MAAWTNLREPHGTYVMGILNVTPDSFSDGGSWLDLDAAVARGYRLMNQGADIIDVGGESTRPGAAPLSSREEWDRIGAVVRSLSQAGIPVSVDTYHAHTARLAVEAGAAIINDVTGGAGDPSMFSTVAGLRCLYVLQHTRGMPQNMNTLASYSCVPDEVATELSDSITRALGAGISRDRIIVDPGFGFAKDADHNWDLAAHMEAVEALGQPILVGVSRKRFLADVASGPSPAARDDATAALTSYFASRGVWGVRVHEVAASKAAVLTAEKLREAGAFEKAGATPGADSSDCPHD